MVHLPYPPASGPELCRAARVLFVDDDPTMLALLCMVVKRARPQWETEFVDSGARALEALTHSRFDVMLTDLEMPRMHGLALLAEVAERYPTIVRVIHSAVVCAADPRGLAALSHAVVSKPADPHELLCVLDRACESAWQQSLEA